ncbi:autotransporter-associated beta strand repeat-containing protein, partial [Acidithiobacillus ferrivorans]|uniref:autotransporter-associated beta strand repeat-containing protein n=1 Tax=Acidithiobacillus ferrivorans TaxID=160808 RepID=UPI001C079681
GVSGTGFTVTNNGTITGGNGGNGGYGNGGYGVSGTGFTVTNNGTITGGTDGTGTLGGFGVTGIVSTGDSTIINAGIISGGTSAGSSQADAVYLSGGGNTLILESGYVFNGNVVSASGTTKGGDTLVLGGSTSPSASFNVSNVLARPPTAPTSTQYIGFNKLEENASTATTWTITGTNNSGLGWNLDGGILSVSSAGALGNYTTTFNGGTLLTMAGMTDSRTFSVNVGGGTINNHGNSDTFSGAFSGNGGMTFFGPGSTILSAANSYSGGTTVNGGTLALTGTGSIADSSGVTNNGSFDISGVT